MPQGSHCPIWDLSRTHPSLAAAVKPEVSNHHGPYIWSNYAVLAIGVWAIAQRDSIDAIFMYLVGTITTILLDIIHIAIKYEQFAAVYSSNAQRDQFRFSVGMAILSLLLKPVSCLFVYQMYKQRGGDCYINIDLDSSTDSRFTCDSVESNPYSSRSY
ncbi:type-1 angiotensin II receptor-associated protein isoform X3 [Hemitrygon akajei]|uniref:type-1 angiotensin II receptor-associated protein isoform X3 n=1 Tax=Hemitrygon akajei TaxID=2704970 RepID=UPI003BFA06A3